MFEEVSASVMTVPANGRPSCGCWYELSPGLMLGSCGCGAFFSFFFYPIVFFSIMLISCGLRSSTGAKKLDDSSSAS